MATRAQATLDELLDALARDTRPVEPSLDEGAGYALLWHYAHLAFPGRGYDARREAALDDVVERLANTLSRPTLISGFVGAAWVMHHLSNDNDEDPVEAIDAALADLLTAPSWPGPFDLLHGLAGIGVYALARAHRETARLCLEHIVDKLGALVEPRPGGLAWRTRPELRPDEFGERWPNGNFDLGVAHGTPGVVTVLAGAVAHNVARDRARRLLDGAFGAMWHARRHNDDSVFGYWESEDGQESSPSRLAWCYGDAGASVALYAAASAGGNAEARVWALEIARVSATRDLASSGVCDSALCHGAAGLALLYARLANDTGEAIFADASRRWYEDVLTRVLTENLHARDASFLMGSSGVALALLAGMTSIEPQWDQVLAASVPSVTSVR